MTRLWVLLLLLLPGCAPGPAPRASAPDPSELDATLAAWDRAARRDAAGSRRLATFRSTETVTIAPPPPRAERGPGRQHRIDVRFHGADLADVARLLADAGGFAVVTDGTPHRKVSVELRRVRPYEALVAIAEAHGARVSRRGSLVIVRGP